MSINLKKIVFHENKGMGDFIAKIEVPFRPGIPDFILLLDNTNNMINHFQDIVNTVIPSVFEQLKYSNKNVILITFTNQEIISIQQMKSKNIQECPHFQMAGAIDSLKKVFENYKGARKQIRILTLSAGEIDDQITTKFKIDSLVKSFSQQFLINSQGIRLMVTEEANPETRALCSMLRLTNISTINTELLELTPFREEDYLQRIIESSEYTKIVSECEKEKYDIVKCLSEECNEKTKSISCEIEEVYNKWIKSKECIEYEDKDDEIYYKLHFSEKKDCYDCQKHKESVHYWHNYPNLCEKCKIKEKNWKPHRKKPNLCVECLKKGLTNDKKIPAKECEKCKKEDLSIFGHITWNTTSCKCKFYIDEKIKELSSNISNRPLKTYKWTEKNKLEAYKILYNDVLDELLKLQILKINRDKKINNLRFNGVGKKYFDLIKGIRIIGEIRILDKEGENEDPEKEKLREEINNIREEYKNKIKKKNENEKEELIDKYIVEIKKKIFSRFNAKENQEKIKEINEKYDEESDKIIYGILYKNFENSNDDFQKYREYKDIVFKRNYKNNKFDENIFVQELSDNKKKYYDSQNYYQFVIECEKKEKKIDKKWGQKINNMYIEFQKMVNKVHMDCLKSSEKSCHFSCYDLDLHKTSDVKFKTIEKAVLDLSLAYYYYCQSQNKRKITKLAEEMKNNLLKQKNVFENQLKVEYKTKEEVEGNRKICTEMLEKINDEFLDWNEDDSWEGSEEDIKNFRKIYFELYLNQIKEKKEKKLGHEIIEKIDKYTIKQRLKTFEKKMDKKIDEKYEFKNPVSNNLYVFFYTYNIQYKDNGEIDFEKSKMDGAPCNPEYCHIYWNKDLCKNIFYELLIKYINYDYNHLLYYYYSECDCIWTYHLCDEKYKQLEEEINTLWRYYYYTFFQKYDQKIKELRKKAEVIIAEYNNKKSNEFEKISSKYEKQKDDIIVNEFERMRKEINDDLVGLICTLFEKDGLNEDAPFVLESPESILKNNPYDKPSNKIILNNGNNTVFCQNKPESIKVCDNNDNEINLNIEQGEDINAYNYIEIIGKDKITYIIQKSSINKIADTEDSRSESTDISTYFSNFDNSLDGLENTLDGENRTISSILNDINSTKAEEIENKKVNDFIKEKIELTKSKLTADLKPLSDTNELYFVLIMDTSDEMKNDIKDAQKTIHLFLNKLGYKDDQEMTILTFNNKSIDIDIEDLPTTKLKTKGNREMSEIFDKLRNIVKENSDKKFQILFFISGKIKDEDESQIEAYKFKNEINNKVIVQTNVIQYKSKEKKDENNYNLYSETTHALLRNISTIAIDLDAKFTTMYYNDSEETRIKKLMNLFCSYKNRADLKLEKAKVLEGLTKSINICDLEYKNGNVQDKNEENEKIEEIRKALIKAFKDLK